MFFIEFFEEVFNVTREIYIVKNPAQKTRWSFEPDFSISVTGNNER